MSRPFRFHLKTLGFLWLSLIHVIAADETAQVSIRIVNDSGVLTAARAWIDVDGERLFEPTWPDSVTVYARDRSFSCDGVFTMDVPIGEALLHVEKGKEFTPVDLGFKVESGAVIERTIQIKQWIDMPSLGWYSADLHVHLGQDDPRVLAQLALADDVHLVPAFTYWLRGQGERWRPMWPDETFTTPIAIDRHHWMTRNNVEIERIQGRAKPGGSIGATFLFNLKRPVTAERYGEFFPTDATLCRAAQSHSPEVVLDSDKPSWAESVIGVALGALDTVQVCHNHYHRDTTLSGGWGMIGPLAAGESNAAVGNGLFHRTNALYYRFLNCGFRLGVSGGSAIGVMPVPTGFHRVYARVDGEFTVDKLWASIKTGHSFATTGPMLRLRADGKGIGETITRQGSDSKPIEVTTTVQSMQTLEALQIVINGHVVASLDLRQQKVEPTFERDLKFKFVPGRSGWVVARALFRAPDGLLRQAHTSPIYVFMDAKPTAFAEDARYMLRWVDVLTSVAQSGSDRFPDKVALLGVLAIYAEAKKKYEQVLQDAEHHWGDF